jgi:hypothetical protein
MLFDKFFATSKNIRWPFFRKGEDTQLRRFFNADYTFDLDD